MIETILLARERATGKYIPLSNSADDFSKLKAKLHEFDHEAHDDYDRVGLYQLVPQKKVLKLLTEKELADQKALHARQNAAFTEHEELMRKPIDELRSLAAKAKAAGVTDKSSKSEIVAAIQDAKSGKPYSGPIHEAKTDREELAEKTMAELQVLVSNLNADKDRKVKIVLKSDLNKDQVVALILDATKIEAEKTPGLFTRLFGK